jgi:integrase/DNA-directed RNA polymerase subunit RPC12/RpoP
MAEQKLVQCPQCNSTLIWKDGLRYMPNGNAVQRYICRNCGYRFSETSLKDNALGKAEKQNRTAAYWREGPLTLEAEIEKRDAGATETSQSQTADIKGKLVEFAWWMKKQGYAESTIVRRVKALEVLWKRGANLYDPESVKEVISKQNWSENGKDVVVRAYSCFLKMVGGSWNPPIIREVEKLPFIPTEQELDSLIAAVRGKLSIFLQLLKETGMRAGEAWNLKWSDIDFENGTVRITPEKGSKARCFKLSARLQAMLNRLERKSEWIFKPWKLQNMRRTFQRVRNKLSVQLCNPRLKLITFHTFRHWKATMEYAKTKDILHVMQVLGHKNIQNTLKYTQLIKFEEDEFVCKTAKTVQEAFQLIEAGFEYVCEIDGIRLFRKRK